MARLSVLFVLLAALLGLSGCVGSKPYHTTVTPAPDANGIIPGGLKDELQVGGCAPIGQDKVAVVEYDDYGNLYNRRQLTCALDAISQTAKQPSTILVFVHGWHNSAEPREKPNERNLEAFKAFVKEFESTQQKLAKRQNAAAAPPVVGLFVGWRGDSIEATGVTMPLSFGLTFWGRKSAAEAIGHSGGVTELMLRLERVRQDNPETRVVAIGHSFGGALIYSAVVGRLIDRALADQADVKARRNCSVDGSCTRFAPDLLVLVNPAIEAMRFRPYFDLVRRWEHGADTPPRLIVATSETDWPVKTVFPLGRWFSTFFDSYGSNTSQDENRNAIGRRDALITHELRLSADKACQDENAVAPGQAVGAELEAPSTEFLCMKLRQPGEAKAALRLQRCNATGQCTTVSPSHFLSRGSILDGNLPDRLPYLNIRVAEDVVDGHGDIWNTNFLSFLEGDCPQRC